MHNFLVDHEYTRKDVYRIVGVSEDTKGGNWDTGYNKYLNDYYIFTNVGVPGRTGHDYGNRFEGNNLIWYAKSHTKINNPQIQDLLNPPGYIYLFYRTDNSKPFVFAGTVRSIDFQDATPVQITWKILNDFDIEPLSRSEIESLPEGQRRQIITNAFERNPEARKRCVEYYGYICSICGLDFMETYGEIGNQFIHVHHIKPISEINEEYYVNPINDLRPVCPNCHSMIHRRKPCYTIDEIKEFMAMRGGNE